MTQLVRTGWLLLLVGAVVVGSASLLPASVQAQGAGQDIAEQLKAAAGAQGAALGEPIDPRVTIIFIIRVLLGLTTLVLVSLNVYAGFLWMTAGGNEEQVTKAKDTIRNATIGLIIVLSAYSITIFATYLARGLPTGARTPFQGFFGSFLK